MSTKIPSTNPHKLRAERVARVTKALIRRLIGKGVLPASSGLHVDLRPVQLLLDLELRVTRAESDGVLDCRPRLKYLTFRVIQGDKGEG